ncbi:response regulator [Terrimonas ferruginea]|uniref:response regulator n=1 Tax=Terrimonas ferruginea TaxID=249 RepID=UPI0004912C81|nr:response regulator [Terrimonas ferruginea]
MNKNIIVVEDDQSKAEEVLAFLRQNYPQYEIVRVSSYNSAMRFLQNSSFDLMILDVTLPTFEDEHFIGERSFEKFGGVMILRELKRKRKLLPTILFTMFDDFGIRNEHISLDQISKELEEKYSTFFLGAVFYESPPGRDWATSLQKIMNDNNFNCG